MTVHIGRRELLTTLAGAAAAWPLAARAQQPAMPVVGHLSTRAPRDDPYLLTAFRRGLSESGFVGGRNVSIEFRWAEGQYDRLPAMADDLVRRNVAVIAATGGIPSALAAKSATTTIPMVFYVAVNPVEFGLVASLARPAGNVTGVTSLGTEVGPKRLELLHELLPSAKTLALLVNPTNPNAETLSRDLQAAARALGLELHFVHASAERDFDRVFATLAQFRADGLVIGPDAAFTTHSEHLAALTIRHRIPTIYNYRAFVAAGGLMSYGGSFAESYRAVGVYTGRVLKGEKPADLPVQQSTKVELIINMKTAKALGITIPIPLLGRADEVIE